MIPDVQLIRKELILRKESEALQKEVETLRTELLAAEYEADHASSWFTAKKKQALIQKRDIVQNQLTLKEEKLLHFSTASLRCLADQCQLLNDKHHSTTSKRFVEILNFAVRTELYLTALTELDNALNECFVEQINVRDQAAITNKTINLSPVLPLLPGFLDHDARYRNQLHEFNQKSLLSQPLRLRRLDFTRLSAMDKQSELRFFGKQCQPLKADLQTILRKLEDQAICFTSELAKNLESCSKCAGSQN